MKTNLTTSSLLKFYCSQPIKFFKFLHPIKSIDTEINNRFNIFRDKLYVLVGKVVDCLPGLRHETMCYFIPL